MKDASIIVCIGFVTESSNWNWPVTTDLNLPRRPLVGSGWSVVPPGSGLEGIPLYIPKYSFTYQSRFAILNIVWFPSDSICSFRSLIVPELLVSQYISNLDSTGSVS